MSAYPDMGGPAFPNEGGDMSGLVAHPGMSLRDYFAGQALQGILAGICTGHQLSDRGSTIKVDPSIHAMAYITADAMLEARKLK